MRSLAVEKILNFLDDLGQNVYAQMSVDANENIYFDEWVDGGDGLVIQIDNGSYPSSLLVTLLIDGDFNLDGVVDGADFLLWQRDPSVGSLADWEANYGVGAQAAGAATIPEPATIISLQMMGLSLSGSRKWLRKSRDGGRGTRLRE
jgi:hypothetical protein